MKNIRLFLWILVYAQLAINSGIAQNVDSLINASKSLRYQGLYDASISALEAILCIE